MTSIELTLISGVTPPYIIYACDIYGSNCIPIATVSTFIPPSNVITLPPAFNYAPAVGIKVISSECEHFEIFFCQELFPKDICLEYKVCTPSCSTYEKTFYRFEMDENINNKPSWIGSVSGSTELLYWDGSQWIISPLGITNSNQDLYFGLWSSSDPIYWSILNTNCVSICIVLFDGIDTTSYFLQYGSSGDTISETFYYTYDDGFTNVIVIWNDISEQWELYLNSVLSGTLMSLDINDVPIGDWVIEPLVPYLEISTVLECPEDFKQFQNTEYFYFMDGIQYNFQN